MEGDYVLVAREHCFAGEKLILHGSGPRCVVSARNAKVFEVEDLRSVLGSRFRDRG